ncbi:superoxide dismutase family protein [uncultured Paracoccus sp.]|uniref:superoxide dismutase family protein n=1 Tax=uncultured Paracoccus sp. TaxID=189685 RepID=UPI0026304F7B|nr:superoxide dismutase family protein [uncultured Paracoccus sp.]
MTRSTTETRILSRPGLFGALMLGASLIVMPMTAFSQTATAPADAGTAPAEAPAADASAGSAAGTDAAASGTASDTAAAGGETTTTSATQSGSGNAQAAALLKGADGTEHGSVTASDTASGALHVILHLSSLPDGPHAVHIHETGKCEGPTFESAGGHLAGDKDHGAFSPNGMHPGDLPNVDAADGGAVNQEFFLQDVTLSDVMNDDGGAFIVHAGTDDYTSQPAGNAGDRIACGVFEATTASN